MFWSNRGFVKILQACSLMVYLSLSLSLFQIKVHKNLYLNYFLYFYSLLLLLFSMHLVKLSCHCVLLKILFFLLLIRQSTCTKLLYILRTVSNYSVWSFVRAGDVLELSKEKTNKYFLKHSSFNMINNTFSQNKISSTRPLINWMIKHMFSLFSKLCLLLISSNSCCSIYFISQLHKISLFKCPIWYL